MDELKVMHNPAHPGEILKQDYLIPLGMSVSELARALGASRKHLSLVVNGRANVSADLGLRLSKALDTSAKLWLDLQQNYEVWQVKQRTDLSGVEVLSPTSRELVDGN